MTGCEPAGAGREHTLHFRLALAAGFRIHVNVFSDWRCRFACDRLLRCCGEDPCGGARWHGMPLLRRVVRLSRRPGGVADAGGFPQGAEPEALQARQTRCKRQESGSARGDQRCFCKVETEEQVAAEQPTVPIRRHALYLRCDQSWQDASGGGAPRTSDVLPALRPPSCWPCPCSALPPRRVVAALSCTPAATHFDRLALSAASAAPALAGQPCRHAGTHCEIATNPASAALEKNGAWRVACCASGPVAGVVHGRSMPAVVCRVSVADDAVPVDEPAAAIECVPERHTDWGDLHKS